ncbi:MAG TPA: polysaccharide pyruvyl transferase family protein, partial [Gemmatimonadales bacterium]
DLAPFLASMHAQIDAVLAPLLPPGTPVALLDFPDHGNVGDSAIWLGETAALRALGIRHPVYVCRADAYDRRVLAKVIGDGVILLHGGGNFGDLWPYFQRFREQVVQDFPDHRIVILPQSIMFTGREALDRARRVLDAHRRLTILVRSRRSLELAAREFQAPSHLCPDMALRLPPLEAGVAPGLDFVWLSRTDPERSAPEVPPPPDVRQVDWVAPDMPFRRLMGLLHRRPTLLRHLGPLVYDRLAWIQVRRGLRILGSGRGVVTDRLHAHILCLLAGIPHCILDNNYGKVRAVYETWTQGVGRAAWCASPEEAFARIRELTVAAEPQSARAGTA